MGTFWHGSMDTALLEGENLTMNQEPDIIKGLKVDAAGSYKLEISPGDAGLVSRLRHRVEVHAEVNATTGEVRFFVDPADIDTLR